MKTRVLIVGYPCDVAAALTSMRAPALTVTADPTLLERALEELRGRGHEVVEDPRLRAKILLELTAVDVRRLRLLEAADESHVLAAARHAIHEHLDRLVAVPACAHCRPGDPSSYA